MIQKKAQAATRGISKYLLLLLLLIIVLLILKVTGLVDFSRMTQSWSLITNTFRGGSS